MPELIFQAYYLLKTGRFSLLVECIKSPAAMEFINKQKKKLIHVM